jgi:bifunctional NMN adenylyltransferase/nudix hydrolase
VRATLVRKHYFAGSVNFDATGWQNQGLDWPALCPQATIEFLRKFRDNPAYAYLMKQKAAEEAYAEKWGKGPFQTVDPVIVQGGYVAMIERGGLEGEGSIGLPGGFLDAGEDLLWAAAREAVEETAIFIPPEKMDGFKAWLATARTCPMPAFVEPPSASFSPIIAGAASASAIRTARGAVT